MLQNNSNPYINQYASWTNHSMNHLGIGRVSNGAKQIVEKFEPLFAETQNGSLQTIDWSIFPINDSNSPGIATDAVILIGCDNSAPDPKMIAYFTYIFETSIPDRPLTFQTNDGRQVTRRLVADDLFNDEFKNRAINLIKHSKFANKYPNGNVICDAGMMVITRDVNLEEQDHINALFEAGGKAILSHIGLFYGYRTDTNIRDYMIANTKLQQTITLGRNVLSADIATITRADVIATTYRNMVQQAYGVGGYDAARPIMNTPESITSGHYDFSYFDNSGFFDSVLRQNDAMCKRSGLPADFIPESATRSDLTYNCISPIFVITGLLMQKDFSAAAVLLSLALGIDVAINRDVLVQAIMPSAHIDSTGKVNKFHDIGNIGFDVPLREFTILPECYDYHDFTQYDYHDMVQFVNKFMAPTSVAIDLTENSANSYQFKFLLDAVRDVKGETGSVANLEKTLNELTNGHWASVRKEHTNAPLTSSDIGYIMPAPIPMGYYYDEGVVRDLRDFDYLSFCRYFEHREDGRSLDEYYQIMWGENQDRNTKIHYLQFQLDMASRNTAVVTGFASRLIFSSTFINDLLRACERAGLKVTKDNREISTRGRVGFNYHGHGLTSNPITGTQVRSGNPYFGNGYTGYQNNYYTR